MSSPFPIIKRHIDVNDKRDIRALEILATSMYWKEIEHSRHDGQRTYEIDSSSRVDRSYHVTLNDCECEDHKYRGQTCSHIRAVRLFCNIVHSHINRAAYGHELDIKAEREREERAQADRRAKAMVTLTIF
jgi:hypothetical protein